MISIGIVIATLASTDTVKQVKKQTLSDLFCKIYQCHKNGEFSPSLFLTNYLVLYSTGSLARFLSNLISWQKF